MEPLFYEAKPFLITCIAMYGMFADSAPLFARFTGVILLGCAVAITYARARKRGYLK